MRKNILVITSFLVICHAAFALVPVEGLILGRVDGTKQTDPFAKMLTYRFTEKTVKSTDEINIERYIGLYRQGLTLKNQCDKSQTIRYSSDWKEASAKRSFAATLQYIGLDISLKAIVEYARKFEYTQVQFKNLADNLVRNYCNPNLSVYSLKLLRNNFDYFWKNPGLFVLPEIKNSPYYSKGIKKVSDTLAAAKNNFNYTIKNFRAFCSWNGDTDNYFLMTPYLNDPFLMSFVSNNMERKVIALDSKTKEIFLRKSDKSARVVCEDLICRNRSDKEFVKYFPRMIGSTNFRDDLKFLYCEHFKNKRVDYKQLNPTQKKWINAQTYEEPRIEVMNFFGLITKFPDLFVMSSKFSDLYKGLKINIKDRWDEWADKKLSSFDKSQFYEEPFEVRLNSQAQTNRVERGDFNIVFDVNLGEIDKMLNEFDKITMDFNLVFSNKYLAHIQSRLVTLHNLGRFDEEKNEINKFESIIFHQLEQKAKHLTMPLANKGIAKLMAKEIIDQLSFYRGNKLKDLKYKEMIIPVELRFGVYALQYLRKKYQADQFEKEQLARKNK